MTIEQLFRDNKSKRNGWSLRDTQLKTPQRLDRLLLILALAYLLLCGIGLVADRTHEPSAWCSNSKEGACSIFLIGLLMHDQLKTSPPPSLCRRPRSQRKHGDKVGMTQVAGADLSPLSPAVFEGA